MAEKLDFIGHKQFDEGDAKSSPQARAGNIPNIKSLLPSGVWLGDELGSFVIDFARTDDEIAPWWNRQRDADLRRFLRRTPIVSGVVNGEVTRVKNQAWVISSETGDIDEVKRWHEILQLADFGNGFAEWSGLIANALMTQDNGAFIELIDGKNSRSRTQQELEKENIESFAYLDPAQCWRTFDPEYPVAYQNPWTGKIYIYHHSRIIAFSQFNQGYELGRNVGYCALSRTLQEARIARETGVYLYEKISGQSQELYFVAGMAQSALNRALAGGREDVRNAESTLYKNAQFIAQNAFAPNLSPVDVKKVGLKDVPDGWDREKELTLAVYCIALGFGLDAREIWPATQSGATKADAEVQHRKASSKGRAEILRTIEHILNHRILPDGITFRYKIDDEATQNYKARTFNTMSSALTSLVSQGILLPQQATEILAMEGFVPREFVPETMDEQISALPEENETPESAAEDSNPGTEPNNRQQQKQPGSNTAQAQKELSSTETFFRQFLVELLESAQGRDYIGFLAELQAGIRQFGEQAFVDGLRAAGVDSQLGNLPRQLFGVFQNEIQLQQLQAINLANAVFAGEKVAHRVDLWVNKGLGEMYNVGKLIAIPDKHFKWVLGPTEHCGTCLGMSDHVHSAADLYATGIYPRSSLLDCGGYNCQCELEETDLPVTNEPINGIVVRTRNIFSDFLRRLGIRQ